MNINQDMKTRDTVCLAIWILTCDTEVEAVCKTSSLPNNIIRKYLFSAKSFLWVVLPFKFPINFFWHHSISYDYKFYVRLSYHISTKYHNVFESVCVHSEFKSYSKSLKWWLRRQPGTSTHGSKCGPPPSCWASPMGKISSQVFAMIHLDIIAPPFNKYH